METHMEAPQELVAALTAHGEALAAELRALDDMPQVKLMPASVFDRAKPPGSIAQKRGVICRLLCCGQTLDQKCNDRTDAAACPTHFDAARLLRAKVAEQHGSATCLAKAAQKLKEEGAGSSGQIESAFSVMMGAQIARQRAGSELMQAEDELQSLRSKVAAAEQRLEEVQVEARRLGLGAKRPRAEPEWKAREYGAWCDVEYWRQEEGRIYNRRRQQLSTEVQARPAEQRPRGQEHGPLQHWRLGLVGAVQYWSSGSEDEAADLISRLIVELKLQARAAACTACAQPDLTRCCCAATTTASLTIQRG